MTDKQDPLHIQRLLRFRMCGWRGTALMPYAVRAICKAVEQVGDTLLHLFRWRCTAEPTPPLIGKKAQRLSNVTRAASAVNRTEGLSGYVLYDCLDECGKRLALILLESRNTII